MEQCKHDPQSHRYTRAVVNGTGKYTQIDVGCLWAQPVYKHLVLNGQHQMAFLSYGAEFEHIGSMFQGKRKESLRDLPSDDDIPTKCLRQVLPKMRLNGDGVSDTGMDLAIALCMMRPVIGLHVRTSC